MFGVTSLSPSLAIALLKSCAQFCVCCHLKSKHIAPQWPLKRVTMQGFCHFFYFNVLDAEEIKMQWTFLHTVKYRDYLGNRGILSKFF